MENENVSNEYHIPVLLAETIEGLNIKPGGVYVDCTFGGGGHSREILSKLGNEGKLFVFDQDETAKANIPQGEKRITFIAQNFRHLQRFLKLHGVTKVDGILADWGVSSHQFDEAERGFSTRYEGPLDMRMDKRQQKTAAELVRDLPAASLHKMFEMYGEVTNSKTLANTITTQRDIQKIETISQFKQAVHHVVKGNPKKYFAQVFQALRIEVNDEMGALKDLLTQSNEVLREGGRIAIISFHSLEDRLVKNFFRFGNFTANVDEDEFGTKKFTGLNIITKKPVTAGKKELEVNNRSRSAKLRVAEKN